ncbi:thiamine diphosphokinase [Desulfitobacterium metallireducens]|uniref:Thiamine diphosphokinase n=1 Tax=Desulfitobacterium metallireducens DSM 15288 TaxID=871968 RepID=W0EEY1_9FIRM|nr:thiamine diphosphokinase [Desulfitobacterium metallireducens]AHF07631.1 thiamine pyrophosphokinase [Desulfitobacterium metallireducens DSM 15288]
MRVAVVANGEWDVDWGSRELAQYDMLICADGGGNYALQSGRVPKVLIGDLDSITPGNLELCRQKKVHIEQFPREKDETDLELALEYAVSQLNPQTLWLYGATGGRVDHLLGNLALLLNFHKRGYCIHIKDPLHEIYLLQGREELKGRAGQELSLIPVSEKARVTTEGLYYPLQGDVILQDSPRGISNVFLGEEAVVEVEEGIVLLVVLA